MKPKIRTPYFEIGVKNYVYGDDVLKMALHADARGCHNTDAHLRSALVGRSEVIAVYDGEMDLGEFGFIYFIDFDKTRARQRTVDVIIMGE